MALRYGDRHQESLLPPRIDDYVSAEDPVRVYDAFIDALNFNDLGLDECCDRVGNAKYDPRGMLKLLVYGYSYGVRSSRKLERACHHNLAFIWLVGGLRPDHKTIASFRRRNTDVLRKAILQCARLCIKLDLVEGNVLFVDGTKIRGNVSKEGVLKRSDIEASLQEVSKRIDSLLRECEQVDSDEASSASLVAVQTELRSQKQLQEKITETLKEFELRDVQHLSGSDKDARMVKDGKGYSMGYNAQVVTDKKHGVIVQCAVADSAVDCHQLSQQIQSAEHNTGKVCKTAIADAGYWHNDILCQLVERGIEVLVPDSQETRVAAMPMSNKCFSYVTDGDYYLCPQGEKLQLVRTDRERKQKSYRIVSRRICRNCKHWGSCTTSIQGRVIKRSFYADVITNIRRNFKTPRARRLFALRKIRGEHPFAFIKENLGYRSLLMRGKAHVQGELLLMSLAYNVRRMWGIFGVKPLIQALV